MFLLTYNLILLFILLLASPVLIVCFILFKHYRAGLGERLGFLSKVSNGQDKPLLWIHGSSVGEHQTILPFINEIRSRFPGYELLFSATTMAGVNLLKSQNLPVIYFPIDLLPIAKKVLNQLNPRMIWVLETELWPSFIYAAKTKEIPLVLLNGRISDHSFKRYHRVRLWVQKVLNQFDAVLTQTTEDKNRFIQLGLNEALCTVTGNMKFDAACLKKAEGSEIDALKTIYGIEEGDRIWVCGSTHGEEEKLCTDIYQTLHKKFHSLRLIVAPRHIQRVKEIEKVFKKRNINYALRSKLNKKNGRVPVLLLDTIGELHKVYALADLVFIGRSLDGFGGQNPLEPAIYSKPVLFGPHMENFRESAEALLECEGALGVKNKNALEEKLTFLLHQPELARQMGQNAAKIFQKHQGAAEKTWKAVEALFKEV